MESVKTFTAIKGVSDMKYYTVKVLIPEWIEKEIYIDDATSKADARKKAKAWGRGEYDAWDCSGDEPLGQTPSKLKIVAVEGGE
jgi:hypothetical protein|tara:strand:+ start:155 stop:406 length:252 start_codon:yes stop_codon:yes gene_type:complete